MCEYRAGVVSCAEEASALDAAGDVASGSMDESRRARVAQADHAVHVQSLAHLKTFKKMLFRIIAEAR